MDRGDRSVPEHSLDRRAENVSLGLALRVRVFDFRFWRAGVSFMNHLKLVT